MRRESPSSVGVGGGGRGGNDVNRDMDSTEAVSSIDGEEEGEAGGGEGEGEEGFDTIGEDGKVIKRSKARRFFKREDTSYNHQTGEWRGAG